MSIERKPKFCRNFLRIYKGKKKDHRVYCGVTKTIERCKRLREFCEVCNAYNKGWEDGYAKKIKTVKKCQLLTCNKSATRVICKGSYLFNVCSCHSNGHEWREIEEGDVK